MANQKEELTPEELAEKAAADKEKAELEAAAKKAADALEAVLEAAPKIAPDAWEAAVKKAALALYPASSEVRKLLVWGVIIIGALLAVAAILMIFLGKFEFQPSDPRQLGFLVAGTAVASILSLISLYSIIVKGHLAPFVSVMALITFGLSTYLIMSPEIGDMRHSRGVITVIFTVGTVSIAMILVMGMMFAKWEDVGDLVKRFEGAKQVLTMLLGILGTVVGFYFGSADDAPPSEPLSVTRVAVDPQEPIAGGGLGVSFSIDGGTRPFIYTLSIQEEGTNPPIEFRDVETTERHIKHLVVLKQKRPEGELGIEITVKDGDQHIAKLHKPLGAWVKTKAPETAPAPTPTDTAKPGDEP